MGSRPTGTVTFLFTDVVGSTARWEADPATDGRGPRSPRRGDAHGDSTRTAGTCSPRAATASRWRSSGPTRRRPLRCDAQRSLRAASWPGEQPLSVRMGAHTGDTVERDGDYFGPAVNRAARVMDAANDDQFVVTSVTDALVPRNRTGWSPGRSVPHRFKGLEGALDVVEVVIDDRDDLGALRHGGGRVHGLPGSSHLVRRPGPGVGRVPGGYRRSSSRDRGGTGRFRQDPAGERGRPRTGGRPSGRGVVRRPRRRAQRRGLVGDGRRARSGRRESTRTRWRHSSAGGRRSSWTTANRSSTGWHASPIRSSPAARH